MTGQRDCLVSDDQLCGFVVVVVRPTGDAPRADAYGPHGELANESSRPRASARPDRGEALMADDVLPADEPVVLRADTIKSLLGSSERWGGLTVDEARVLCASHEHLRATVARLRTAADDLLAIDDTPDNPSQWINDDGSTNLAEFLRINHEHAERRRGAVAALRAALATTADPRSMSTPDGKVAGNV